MKKVAVCLGFAAASIVLPQEAYANQPCSSISNPAIGTICYYDHPWNVRQRDEGGWKDVEFITERASAGWVIDSFQVIRNPGGHGTVEEPNCNFVSGSGQAEITSTTSRSRRSLSELKAKLESKLSVPIEALKAEVRNEIDALNREIANLDQVESSIVAKGGNEALKCRARTYVKCSKTLGIEYCGQGAAASGNVRILRRYLANPVELMARAQEREANANKLLAKIDQQPPPLGPQTCPGGTQWNGSSCAPVVTPQCPPGTQWNGSACTPSVTPCPAGTQWNGSSCAPVVTPQCPPGTQWNGSSCAPVVTQQCPPGTQWNGSACTPSVTPCPPGTQWNGFSCAPGVTPQCPAGTQWNGQGCVTSNRPDSGCYPGESPFACMLRTILK